MISSPRAVSFPPARLATALPRACHEGSSNFLTSYSFLSHRLTTSVRRSTSCENPILSALKPPDAVSEMLTAATGIYLQHTTGIGHGPKTVELAPIVLYPHTYLQVDS